MGRKPTTKTIDHQTCKKCQAIKITKQTSDGKIRRYYSSSSNWKCRHEYNNKKEEEITK